MNSLWHLHRHSSHADFELHADCSNDLVISGHAIIYALAPLAFQTYYGTRRPVCLLHNSGTRCLCALCTVCDHDNTACMCLDR